MKPPPTGADDLDITGDQVDDDTGVIGTRTVDENLADALHNANLV